PSPVAAGLAGPGDPLQPPPAPTPASPAGGPAAWWPWRAAALAGATVVAAVALRARARDRAS
ncbi:MAG TPA: hypothetical protein VF880_15650, partial [Actinomycetes bacterium]